MIKVQKYQCSSCIYRKDSPLDIRELEKAIADPKMKGSFIGYRACHHAGREKICCRGFWNRHKNDFTLGQVAQRLKAVIFVVRDILK